LPLANYGTWSRKRNALLVIILICIRTCFVSLLSIWAISTQGRMSCGRPVNKSDKETPVTYPSHDVTPALQSQARITGRAHGGSGAKNTSIFQASVRVVPLVARLEAIKYQRTLNGRLSSAKLQMLIWRQVDVLPWQGHQKIAPYRVIGQSTLHFLTYIGLLFWVSRQDRHCKFSLA
jgi:hypothetical protein